MFLFVPCRNHVCRLPCPPAAASGLSSDVSLGSLSQSGSAARLQRPEGKSCTNMMGAHINTKQPSCFLSPVPGTVVWDSEASQFLWKGEMHRGELRLEERWNHPSPELTAVVSKIIASSFGLMFCVKTRIFLGGKFRYSVWYFFPAILSLSLMKKINVQHTAPKGTAYWLLTLI